MLRVYAHKSEILFTEDSNSATGLPLIPLGVLIKTDKWSYLPERDVCISGITPLQMQPIVDKLTELETSSQTMNQDQTAKQKKEAMIDNAWAEAYKMIDHMRKNSPNDVIKITEMCDDFRQQHNIIVKVDQTSDVTLIKTDLTGDGQTRFLKLPGEIVSALIN